MSRKLSLYNRILSAVLALVLLLGSVPVVASAQNPVEEEETNVSLPPRDALFTVETSAQEGEAIRFAMTEKPVITASGYTEGADLQWQIRTPDGIWVDIHGQEQENLTISYALIRSVMDDDGSAAVRCMMTKGEYVEITAPVQVQVIPEAGKLSLPSFGAPISSGSTILSEGKAVEFVTITINYLWDDPYDGLDENVALVEPYIANIRKGDPLYVKELYPVRPGYAPFLNDVEQTSDYYERSFSAAETVEDITIDIVYKLIPVPFYVRYFLQNVNNDLYTEDPSINADKNFSGFAGTEPNMNDIDPKPTGFTGLFIQPDEIAADGSTVFEFYYDRNYYLMSFELDGGHGVAPVYAKYQAQFAVAEPERLGYVFGGWDLVKVNGVEEPDTNNDGVPGDGVADIAAGGIQILNMPAENRTYKALWTTSDTTYTIVYWILDANGNKTFLGSRTQDATSGATVSGKHDLALKSEGGPEICGAPEHTHTDSCYDCGLDEHTHTKNDCFSGMTLAGNKPENGENAIKALESDGVPKSGYIYVIKTASGDLWPKLYLDGSYYTINGIGAGTNPATQEQVNSIVDGELLAETTGTFNGEQLSVYKYKPITSCGEEQHTHTDGCRPCQAHTHGADCYQDNRHLVEVVESADFNGDGNPDVKTDTDIIVEGDGSTIVNVYYQYKEYTLKFYYAKTTGGTDTDKDGDPNTYDEVRVVGGSTWNFGTSTVPGPEDGPQLANVGNWGLVDEFPTLNTEGLSRSYEEGTLTYNKYTYHYISFKARYGDNIANLWPCSVFNSVTRVEANTHGYWSGEEAFVSAWNGEHMVKYTQEHGNETIKGKYEILDENLLFDSKFNDSDEVSYLCFWENGDNVYWSVPELYRYNIYVEPLLSEDITGRTTETYNGKTYVLLDQYDTCDDSDTGSQTQPGLTGFTAAGKKSSIITSFDANLYREAYDMFFYYDRNVHYLKFFNHNRYLQDGRGSEIKYGTALSTRKEYVDYNKANAGGKEYLTYPVGLEKDAYVFEGWYTTPQFLVGTEVNWETMTMPDADLTLYAKWTPVTHDIYLYQDYDHLTAGNHYDMRQDVTHGHANTTYINDPTPANATLTFAGWFYMKNGVKTAFDPNAMEVREEMHLFAEWKSSITTQYEIHYVAAQTDANGTPLRDSEGNYIPDEDTVLAEMEGGYIFVGTTKTFKAKGVANAGDKMWLPHTNSHSILMREYDVDGDGNAVIPENNTFHFIYVSKDSAPYKVEYLDAVTLETVADTKDVKDNKHAVVSEMPVYVEGYTATVAYETLILSADDSQNIIRFYYTKNDDEDIGGGDVGGGGDPAQHYYLVKYYTEDETGTFDASGNRVSYGNFEEYRTDSFLADVGASVDATVITIPGYEHYPDHAETKESGTVIAEAGTDNMLILKLYYVRQPNPYVVQHLEYGTENLIDQSNLQGTDKNQELGYAPYRYSLTRDALSIPGYELVGGVSSKTISIATDTLQDGTGLPKLNVIKFYYKPKQVEIVYTPICTEPTVDVSKWLTYGSERPEAYTGIRGSAPHDIENFTFKGWYLDEACTIPVPAERGTVDPATRELTPIVTTDLALANDFSFQFYALFEPVKKDLTITKKAGDGTTIPGTDSFLFRITGTNAINQEVSLLVTIHGAGSVTIQDLYCGDYTVTEITDWSWTYTADDSQDVTLSESGDKVNGVAVTDAVVTFTNSDKKVPWLHGENFAENDFN